VRFNPPWITVLLEKLIDAQQFKKFSNFYATQKLLAIFT
jgi:hypothetical protein